MGKLKFNFFPSFTQWGVIVVKRARARQRELASGCTHIHVYTQVGYMGHQGDTCLHVALSVKLTDHIWITAEAQNIFLISHGI